MGPQGPGPARINGCAKVLAFWLERDPHINPPQDLGQSRGGAHRHPQVQAQPGSCGQSRQHPAVPAGQDGQKAWGPVSTGPSSLVPAGLGAAGLGKKAQVNPGAATPAQPRGCPLPELYQGRLGGASRRLGLTGTGLPAAEV